MTIFNILQKANIYHQISQQTYQLQSRQHNREKKSIIYLQIAFRGESSAADGADKRFLSGVCALVDL